MKAKTILLSSLGLLALASCQGPTPTPSASSPTDSSAVESSAEPSVEESIYTIDPEEVEEFAEGSVGGQLIDINLNCFLAEQTDYLCRFSPKNLDPTLRIVSSRPESLEVEHEGGEEFTLCAKAPGDSLLSIYDKDDMLCYRKIVRVRKAYDKTEIEEVMYDYDIYGGMTVFGGTYRLTFLQYAPLMGILEGRDEVESGIHIEFTATYSGYVSAYDMYSYDIEITSRNEGSQTRITSFLISRTADQLVLYYWTGEEEAWLDSFYPESLYDLHPYIA